uniref:Uncharacterized protein n=1 Tax=Otarine gammaherpesvirus 4 TaxID=2801541 RepID=A0A8B6T2V7_9GAMA|nr:hypothetical protein [Otarine gammaherpesvirus 4]
MTAGASNAQHGFIVDMLLFRGMLCIVASLCVLLIQHRAAQMEAFKCGVSAVNASTDLGSNATLLCCTPSLCGLSPRNWTFYTNGSWYDIGNTTSRHPMCTNVYQNATDGVPLCEDSAPGNTLAGTIGEASGMVTGGGHDMVCLFLNLYNVTKDHDRCYTCNFNSTLGITGQQSCLSVNDPTIDGILTTVGLNVDVGCNVSHAGNTDTGDLTSHHQGSSYTLTPLVLSLVCLLVLVLLLVRELYFYLEKHKNLNEQTMERVVLRGITCE